MHASLGATRIRTEGSKGSALSSPSPAPRVMGSNFRNASPSPGAPQRACTRECLVYWYFFSNQREACGSRCSVCPQLVLLHGPTRCGDAMRATCVLARPWAVLPVKLAIGIGRLLVYAPGLNMPFALFVAYLQHVDQAARSVLQ